MPAKNGKTKDGKKVREVMTANPVCVTPTTTVMEAAKQMRAEDIGDVLVQDGGNVCIMTDRDVVVRVIAEGRDPATTKVADVCSTDRTTRRPPSSRAIVQLALA